MFYVTAVMSRHVTLYIYIYIGHPHKETLLVVNGFRLCGFCTVSFDTRVHLQKVDLQSQLKQKAVTVRFGVVKFHTTHTHAHTHTHARTNRDTHSNGGEKKDTLQSFALQEESTPETKT